MSSVKVLTVDDSNLTRRKFIAGPLRQAGFEVVEATEGKEGLEPATEHEPDVIISDLLMPNMDGFEFITALREQGVATPIIVATADVQETSRARIDELNAFAFLNKPFKPEILIDLVQKAAAICVE